MNVSAFVGTSVDGFIARLNGDLDFLSDDGGESHGYDEYMRTVDTVVVGRRTFEKIRTFKAWPYSGKRVVVLSSRPLPPDAVNRFSVPVEQMAGIPTEVAAQLVSRGAANVCIDGGLTFQRFLAAGLINRLIVTRVPIIIGSGIPLFGALRHDLVLQHVATRTYRDGFVQTEYAVLD